MKGARVVLATSVSHFINDGNNFLLPVVYAFLVSSEGYSTLTVGILASVVAFLPVITSPFIGFFSRRGGGAVRMMGVAILVWGLALLGLSFGVNGDALLVILASLTVAGFASAFYHPLGGATLTSAFGESQATAMGINGSLGSMGRALYPTFLVVLASWFGGVGLGMSLALVFLGCVSIVASTIPMRVGQEPALKERNAGQEAPEERQETPYFRTVAVLMVAFFAWGIFSRGVSQFLPTLLVDSFHYSFGAKLGLVYTATLLPSVLGQPFWGLASDRFGRRSLLELAIVGSVTSFLLFMFSGSIVWLLIYGFCAFSNFPLVMSLVGDLVPRRSNAASNAMVWNIGLSGGGVLGPALLGLLSASIGLYDSVLYITLAAAVTAVLIPLVPKSRRRSKTRLLG